VSGKFEPGGAVLIVEDEDLLALDMENLLSGHGFGQVLTAPSLERARELLATHTGIAAAIVDLKLPDGSGTELIAELTERGIATVIVTGYDNATHLPVLRKPYTPQALVAAVKRALGGGGPA
jgi:DNA-binding response OmpR family regulator